MRVEFVGGDSLPRKARRTDGCICGPTVRGRGCRPPRCGTGWSIPAGSGLQGEHQRGGDLPDHRDWAHGARHMPMRTSMRSICPRCSCSTWGRAGDPHLGCTTATTGWTPADYITLLRHGRTRGVCEVRQVQRLLADRCGQRQPLAHGEPLMARRPARHWRSRTRARCTTSWTRATCRLGQGPTGWTAGCSPRLRWAPGFDGGGAAKDFTPVAAGVRWQQGSLRIRLYSPYAMEHEAAVSLNGVSIGSATWSGSGTEAALCRGEPAGWRQHGLRRSARAARTRRRGLVRGGL